MSTATNPLITDVFESKDLKVDRDLGVIRGVKVLGHVSANGREYSKSAVSKARTMYEGLRVNINHPKKAGDQRDLADRFGRLTRVREASDGLYADLEYLKSHPLAEMATEAAERMPDQLGLSHNAEGRVVTRNGKQLVEEIIRVRSVDLVSDPATVRGLFEAEGMMDGEEIPGDMGAAPAAGGNAIAEAFKAEINKIIDGDGDVQTKAAAIKDLLKALDQTMAKLNGEKKAAPAGDDKPEDKPTEEGRKGTADPSLAQLQEEVRQLRLDAQVTQLFEAAGVVPEPLQRKAASLLPTAEERKQFVEALKGSPKPSRPRSAGPLLESRRDAASQSYADLTKNGFASAIK